MRRDLSQPVSIGIVTALVGFTSSFAVVLAGLREVGANTAQASSGLAILCLLQGLGMVWLTWRHRAPLTLAWSTPGAALLATQGYVEGGWCAAIGAFLVTGALIVVTGLWRRLGDLIAAIPTPIAQAMLAGVLVTLCLQPFRMLAVSPWLVAPLIVVWVVMQRVSQRWATPAAFAVALAIMIVAAARDGGVPVVAPHLTFTSPAFTWAGILGLALPLFVVTMASQNVPGVAVLGAAGYTVPWRETMLVTGITTMAGAASGGHALNLAAITAALPASAESHPDPKRRWIATATAGWTYVVIAAGAASLTALVAAAPEGIVESVAGLALLATLAAALGGALREAGDRIPAVMTMLLAASGVSVLGVGSAFWALVVGLAARWVLGSRFAAKPSESASPRAQDRRATAASPDPSR
ncbi:MAG: benzoate/H(+) symporter BenE family transporter [Demequinaceae bacterium]|nr:benzoate/H(+) symporter BenE family transporter [Demequinaceae bacterium]